MKEQIKDWLKTYNHDRPWLAEQIGVKPRTVDNWLSSPQVIPDGKIALIKRLMEDDEAAEAARKQKLQPTAQVFSLEVDLPTFRAYSAAALADGKMLEQWAISELNAAAEAAMAPDQAPKPSASTVKPGAIQTPTQPAQAAALPSNITALPPQHIAAEDPAVYQVQPRSKQSS